MNGLEFYTNIDNHLSLKWFGSHEGETPVGDEVYVLNTTTGCVTGIPVEAILDTAWGILEAVLTGIRPARVLKHFTHIVGYYSSVHNWNRSKHAELRGRQAGTYTIDEPAEPHPEAERVSPTPEQMEETMELVPALSH